MNFLFSKYSLRIPNVPGLFQELENNKTALKRKDKGRN